MDLIPNQIKEDLRAVSDVAKELQMKIYVVGGFPRDIVSGIGINKNTDLDLTEAYGNGFDLAFFVSAKYKLSEPIVYAGSGTALVTMPSGRPVEFHNSFHKVPHIIDQLYVMGVKPTTINKDVYARDFTINTLLYDPDNKKIIDITKKGIHDIENKILRTPLSAKKTLTIKPKIILRGIRFKLQLGLTEDPEYAREVYRHIPTLIEFLKGNPTSKMVSRTVQKTLQANPKKAVEEYRKYGILEYLPSNIEIDNVIKEEMFGTTITPQSLKQTAQSKMMQRLINEREKHKAYMRRKKREQKQKTLEKFKILDRAKSGYYLKNPEPEFIKNRKLDKNRKIFEYINQNRTN